VEGKLAYSVLSAVIVIGLGLMLSGVGTFGKIKG
jgi:hypothetical protein